jgi:hypothetical protein|tara:strand:- start:1026 stop:1745 length:720 start_codon:yes stop_codon:yes gene_type:complete
VVERILNFGAYTRAGGDVTAYDFDGTGDYLTAPDHADWDFGSGAFCIELWVYITDNTQNDTFVNHGTTNGETWELIFNGSTKILQWQTESAAETNLTIQETWNPSNATWYHVAFSRDGSNNYRMFVNGTILGSATNSAANPPDEPGDLHIGERGWGGNTFDGRMDEIRISKGVARYTANFTVQTAQHKTDANTVLLIHCGEAIVSGTTGSGATFVESGNTGHTITEKGNVIRDTVVFKF